MATNTNNIRIPALQDGSPYRHMYLSSQQDSGHSDIRDANKMLPPIGFAVFAIIIWILCSRVLRTFPEAQEATGRGDDDTTTVHQLQSNEAGEVRVDTAPPSTVAGAAAVEMAAPVLAAQPPLVCTYRKADGWLEEGSCGVCLADLDDGEAVRVLPACMYYFHAACVGEWLRGHDTCPLCRAPLVIAPADAA